MGLSEIRERCRATGLTELLDLQEIEPERGEWVATLPETVYQVKTFYDLIKFPGDNVIYSVLDLKIWVQVPSGKYYGKNIFNSEGDIGLMWENIEKFVLDGKCWKEKSQR
jgi:hypothetical protein